ncbi:hypothetical protein Gbem_0421 [Citrifermentans bemidjiense Bem]|uniref:Uncharacterized protein n=1 Tax=Citrifermentans bemidjiense (strain ATCC BAA-1014 / DSM 16622 / JCM 12645 / Bem) TaxID=404380 RepID=B5EBI1_CITBB|nr:HEPN domain-containing protein [Citrifermentans bemidjiense]ACH37450.1 hypothetical protein Gbem_0421 [Citrifermentans bemidjiense Bem]
MPDKNYTFQLLTVDSSRTSKIQTEEQMLYSLMSNNDLWNSPKLHKNKIEWGGLSVTVTEVDMKGTSESPQKAFTISSVGHIEPLEKFRLPLTSHIQKQDFSLVYILTDEISEQIACEIYPKLNRIENRLRHYLIKFFVTKLGPDWWRLTADAEMQKKAHQRRNNERVFSQHIDNKAYLIDFFELGKIVYAQTSGYIEKDDIISKLMSLDESVEALKRFKEELQSNYTKYFKETFKDKGFQDKWIRLEEIRHKVAHNNLFVHEDLIKANEYIDSLQSIIDEAEQKIDEVAFSKGEQAAIQESIMESLSQPVTSPTGQFSAITKEILLDELEKQERIEREHGGYVGLSRFVKICLGDQGYDYVSSYNIINELVEAKELELYDKSTADGYPARAIRRMKIAED